jgi:hypothetical protein
VATTQTTGTFNISTQAGQSYIVHLASAPSTVLPFAAVTGTAATAAKTFNGRSIGLSR